MLNGQAISATQKSIKALIDPATQALLDAQNTALAAMQTLQTAETKDQERIFELCFLASDWSIGINPTLSLVKTEIPSFSSLTKEQVSVSIHEEG